MQAGQVQLQEQTQHGELDRMAVLWQLTACEPGQRSEDSPGPATHHAPVSESLRKGSQAFCGHPAKNKKQKTKGLFAYPYLWGLRDLKTALP